MERPPHNILVVCLRYLGDTLLLRPALGTLREKFPAARIDALVSKGTACALDDCAAVSHVIEWERGSLIRTAFLLGKIATARYDWMIDYTGNDRSALVALLSGASLRAVYDRPKLTRWALRRAAYTLRIPPEKKKPHTLIQRLKLLEACGVSCPGCESDLHPRPASLAWADEATRSLPRRWLHAHVASRDMQKAIPEHIARTVFQGVLERGDALVITSGPAPAEREHLSRCIAGLATDHVRAFSDLTWHQLVALISRCGKYWGADTAPAHIAAALQKPMLIHFGPSKAQHWRPLHPIGFAEVMPCECLRTKKTACTKGVPGLCLQQIDPAKVLDRIYRVPA